MCGLVGSVLAWPGESRDTQKPARKENTHARTDTHTHTRARARAHARTSGSEIAKEFEMFSGGRGGGQADCAFTGGTAEAEKISPCWQGPV